MIMKLEFLIYFLIFYEIIEIMNDLNENIDIQVEYVKESIEIRIESFKIELDKLREQFHNQLDNTKLEIKR